VAVAISAQAGRENAKEQVHFHHVHLNVSDIEATTTFYGKIFGTLPVSYANKTPALLTEHYFLFLNQAPKPIKSQLLTGIIHVGWSGIDGQSEYAWWQKQGIEFRTPLSKVGTGEFMYFWGPDREVIEIWTNERHHRFNHVHLLASSPERSARWFAEIIADPSALEVGNPDFGNFNVHIDSITLHVFPDIPRYTPREREGTMQVTDGSTIDHIAFAVRDLRVAFSRLKKLGIDVVKPIAASHELGFRHFFVRSPDGVLVEFVEAKPFPESMWE